MRARLDPPALRTALEAYDAALLEELARALGVNGRGGRRLALVGSVAERLSAPAAVAPALAELPEVLLRSLSLVQRLGGSARAATLEFWLVMEGVEDVTPALRRLVTSGLLVAAGPLADERVTLEAVAASRRGAWRWRYYLCPGAEPAVPPDLLASDLEPAEAPAHPLAVTPWELPRQLYALLHYLKSRPVRVLLSTDDMSKRDLAALAELLGVPAHYRRWGPGLDGPDLHLLRVLAEAASLVARTPDRSLQSTSLAKGLFGLPPVERTALLLEGTIRQDVRSELAETEWLIVENQSGRTRADSDVPRPAELPRSRRHLIEALRRLARPGTWYSAASLARVAMEADPDFLIPRRPEPRSATLRGGGATYRGLRAVDVERPSPSIEMLVGWPEVEGEFVRLFLTRRLGRLGLVETDAGGSVFRVTPLGAHVLGLADAPPLPVAEAPSVIVQPNFEVLVETSGPALALVGQLDRFAELVRFDRVAHFRLTREALYAGLEAGLKADDVLEFFEAHSRGPLPQNVAFSLADWARAHGRLTVRRGATVLETETAEGLDDLLAAHPEALVGLGPTWARVVAGHEEALAAALQGKDVVEVDHRAPPQPGYSVDDDLRIVPEPAAWHWYHRALLTVLADPEDPEQPLSPLRLSPESVQRALAEGYTPGFVEGLLAQGAQHDLTPRQLFVLRGWLGRYPAVSVGQAELLVTDERTAGELLGVEEARQATLEEVEPGVLLLDPARAGDVRGLLERAGVELRPHGEEPSLVAAAPIVVAPPPLRDLRPSVVQEPLEPTWQEPAGPQEAAGIIQRAAEDCRVVAIEYRAGTPDGAVRLRKINPYRIEAVDGGDAFIHAYCHLRDDNRVFAASRIQRVKVLAERFTPAEPPVGPVAADD